MSDRTAADKAANLSAWRAEKIAAGICGRCGVNPLSTTRLCAPCAELSRQEAKNHRSDMRYKGLCHACGKGPLATETLCRTCSDKANAAIQARQARLRAAGLCAYCGKEPLSYSSTWNCQKCLDRKNAQRNARKHGMTLTLYLEWLARGCAVCGRTDDLDIDHDHACCNDRNKSCEKCNRGPLCSLHNTMASILEHPDAINVAQYLTEHRSSAPLMRVITRDVLPLNPVPPLSYDPAALDTPAFAPQ
jgi:hypothetical protein